MKTINNIQTFSSCHKKTKRRKDYCYSDTNQPEKIDKCDT